MERETISKNGTSPKSQMSRENTNRRTCLRLCFVAILFIMLTPFECVFAQDKIKAPVSNEVQKMFLNAVKANDVEKVKLFLANGASANYYNRSADCWDNGRYGGYGDGDRDPFIHAILNNAYDVASFLIQYDRSVIAPRTVGNNNTYLVSPLQFAFDKITEGSNAEGESVLQNTQFFDLILQEVFNPTGGDKKFNDVVKSLTLKSDIMRKVLAKGYLDLLEKLRGYGFELKQDDVDFNLLCYSAGCSNYPYLKILLDNYGANPNYKYRYQKNSSMPVVITPVLMVAAENGCVEIQKLLIEKGADINAVKSSSGQMDGYNSWNVLSINVQKGNNLEFIKWLVEHKADVNPDLRSSSFMTGGNAGTRKVSILQLSREEYKEFLFLNGAR